jgi:hypothetical protein
VVQCFPSSLPDHWLKRLLLARSYKCKIRNTRDVLVDESKQADIENLGDCLRDLGDGQSLGDFSLTIVLYGRSQRSWSNS